VRAGFPTRRARLSAPKVTGRPYRPFPPGPDIEHDPGRLAAWQTDRDKVARTLAGRTYYVARGCGLEGTYYCYMDDGGPRCNMTDPRFPDVDLQQITLLPP